MKKVSRKTRFHKVLFDSDSPFKPKVERKHKAYKRKPKYPRDLDSD